jgi:hypothetical protein
MNAKTPLLMASFFVFCLAQPWRAGLADSSDGYDETGTKKTYYWQGSQINNLSRLGSSADFEDEQRRARGGKDEDQYLASIREQMARQAKKNAQEKTSLIYQGELAGSPIELTYLSPGLRVTLHADALFDENSATMKFGAVDTLARLQTVLDKETQRPLLFVISDAMDDIPQARSLDAERSLFVLSALAMAEKDSGQENLTPETLAR